MIVLVVLVVLVVVVVGDDVLVIVFNIVKVDILSPCNRLNRVGAIDAFSLVLIIHFFTFTLNFGQKRHFKTISTRA